MLLPKTEVGHGPPDSIVSRPGAPSERSTAVLGSVKTAFRARRAGASSVRGAVRFWFVFEQWAEMFNVFGDDNRLLQIKVEGGASEP